MNQVAVFICQDFIQLTGDKLVTDSRSVAKAFNKAHKNVLRVIDGMRDSKNQIIYEHHQLNFELCYENSELQNGKPQKYYRITRDGFAELAMSFTGETARVIRIQFIQAFHAMADIIRRGQANVWKQMQDWTKRNESSLVRASFGSRLMLDRKRALPELKDEYAKLESQIQPDMFAIQ